MGLSSRGLPWRWLGGSCFATGDSQMSVFTEFSLRTFGLQRRSLHVSSWESMPGCPISGNCLRKGVLHMQTFSYALVISQYLSPLCLHPDCISPKDKLPIVSEAGDGTVILCTDGDRNLGALNSPLHPIHTLDLYLPWNLLPPILEPTQGFKGQFSCHLFTSSLVGTWILL